MIFTVGGDIRVRRVWTWAPFFACELDLHPSRESAGADFIFHRE
jgi:hypothetical protein